MANSCSKKYSYPRSLGLVGRAFNPTGGAPPWKSPSDIFTCPFFLLLGMVMRLFFSSTISFAVFSAVGLRQVSPLFVVAVAAFVVLLIRVKELFDLYLLLVE